MIMAACLFQIKSYRKLCIYDEKEKSLGYIYRLANISNKMLQATLNKDTDTMAEILQYAHNTETPILSYNNEVELSAIVNLVYLSARDFYRIEREDKAGKGFVDFIFILSDMKIRASYWN